MMRKHRVIALATGLALMAAPAMAADRIAPNCTGCHEAENNTLWGTIVPGTQTDSTVHVVTGSTVWKVRYDKESNLEGFLSALELRDEKAVSVEFQQEDNGWVYADEMSYKPSYHFHSLENVITMSEVGQILQKSPEQGNYMILDARGYDNFIEGHLPNATLVPYYRLSEFKDRLPADKNTQIIAYCRGFT